jgi:hypothetical protein
VSCCSLPYQNQKNAKRKTIAVMEHQTKNCGAKWLAGRYQMLLFDNNEIALSDIYHSFFTSKQVCKS